MSNEEFYERLRTANDFPTTSQPPAGAFVEVYESLDAYDDILVLTLSGEMSGTYDSAVAGCGDCRSSRRGPGFEERRDGVRGYTGGGIAGRG